MRRWEVVRCWAGVGSRLVPTRQAVCLTYRGACNRASLLNRGCRIPGMWFDVRRVGTTDHDPRPELSNWKRAS